MYNLVVTGVKGTTVDLVQFIIISDTSEPAKFSEQRSKIFIWMPHVESNVIRVHGDNQASSGVAQHAGCMMLPQPSGKGFHSNSVQQGAQRTPLSRTSANWELQANHVVHSQVRCGSGIQEERRTKANSAQ